jgi:hypothetical protein
MAATTLQEMAQRLARLETELNQLKARLADLPQKQGWEAIVGLHGGDREMFQEIVREGQKYRRNYDKIMRTRSNS